MCEYAYSFIQWKNRVRTMTFGFGFCSVLYGVRVLAKPTFWFGCFLLWVRVLSHLNAACCGGPGAATVTALT